MPLTFLRAGEASQSPVRMCSRIRMKTLWWFEPDFRFCLSHAVSQHLAQAQRCRRAKSTAPESDALLARDREAAEHLFRTLAELNCSLFLLTPGKGDYAR